MSNHKKTTFLFRKKLKFFLKSILLVSCVFIVYQLIMFMQLTNEMKKNVNSNQIVGIHKYQKQFYVPDDEEQFTCIVSLEKIDFKLINDNYCDCTDGSDEPGTNACGNGQFFCALQVNYLNYRKVLPSSQVNDGVCDCCDGSDEWMHKELSFRTNNEWQHKLILRHYRSPCPNLCSH